MSALARADIDLLNTIKQRVAHSRLVDRPRFSRELDRLYARRERGSDFDAALARLSGAIDASIVKVDTLRGQALNIAFDPELPIVAHRDEIRAALERHQVIVLCGATGSGKTTQLPKLCLEAGRGAMGLIGHTQPRRIAARAIAARLAEELKTTVGGSVGYQVRFNERVGPACRIKLMTDGILLKELESDRELLRYDTLIIDEAHERSLNIDLLLGVLKRMLEKRRDLKLIVTSATIDPQKFSEFFGGVPIIEVSGRSYPVEVRYRPLVGEDEDAAELSLPEGVVEAVKELDASARGDVLIFLPGEKQIRECADALTRAKFGNTEILPLFSRLSTRDQERIFEGHSQRRVVLATNVAETSLTVPGVRNVVDSGLARISRYSIRGKVQRLPIEKIARASADQRKGRCGREAEGVCIRLFAEDDFNARDEFTAPEVLRTNLASVILRLAVLGLGEPGDFPFIDPPDTRLVNDGYRLLLELKAVDDQRRVSALGRDIASLPVDPRLARMLNSASHHACLTEMLVVAAFLEIQDPRERPSDAQQQADAAHALFADPRSDFIAVLNLWKAYQEQSQALSGNQLRKWCREHFLSYVRMREWQELNEQLAEAVEDLDLRTNTAPCEYSQLHQSILTGFLGHIGTLDERREYLGARGSRFIIAPGTPLATKPPKWVVAGSMVETTRVFARMAASVEPQWIEHAGEHLLKRSYSEPEWVESKGYVSAQESVSIYGLALAGQRRVNYGGVAPAEARDIFVSEAFVEGRTSFRANFLDHNRTLCKSVEVLEAKIRRRDLLVDAGSLCDFYRSRLPVHIHSIASLDKWLRSPQAKREVAALEMRSEDVLRRDAAEITAQQFPDAHRIGVNELALSYVFEPGEPNDGVTLVVPEPLLGTLSVKSLSWIVPGWHLETITAALRALPKELRKHFVPVPDAAVRCLAELNGAPADDSFAEWVTRESGTQFTAEQFAQLTLPEHLRVNVRVVRLDGKFIAEGRDLSQVRRATRKASVTASDTASQTSVHRAWDFGELAKECVVERHGVKFTVFPGLKSQHHGVTVEEFGTAAEADGSTRCAVVRLAIFALPQQAKLAQRAFVERRELVLSAQAFGAQRALADDFVERAFRQCFLAQEVATPRTPGQFQVLLDTNRARIGETIERLATQVTEIFSLARSVRHSVSALSPTFAPNAVADIRRQFTALLPDHFISVVDDPWFQHLPRYLRGLQRRLERLPGNAKRDAELAKSIVPFASAIERLSGQSTANVELRRLRWMLEEYRVSLFAQDLKTSMPVSEKRLQEQLRIATEAANK